MWVTKSHSHNVVKILFESANSQPLGFIFSGFIFTRSLLVKLFIASLNHILGHPTRPNKRRCIRQTVM